MWLAALQAAVPVIVRFMKWAGFKEEQIQRFILWISAMQTDRWRSTLPSEEEDEAKKKLQERVKNESP